MIWFCHVAKSQQFFWPFPHEWKQLTLCNFLTFHPGMKHIFMGPTLKKNLTIEWNLVEYVLLLENPWFYILHEDSHNTVTMLMRKRGAWETYKFPIIRTSTVECSECVCFILYAEYVIHNFICIFWVLSGAVNIFMFFLQYLHRVGIKRRVEIYSFWIKFWIEKERSYEILSNQEWYCSTVVIQK